MSDSPSETVVESVESQALPTPVVSPPSPATPSAALDASALVSQLKEALLPELKTYIDRSGQSVKDRRFAGIEKKLEELAQAKAYLDASGGDVNKAAREATVDEYLNRQEQEIGSGRTEDWQTGVQKILQEAEQIGIKVPLNDPEIVAASKGDYGSWAEAYAAVNRIVLRRVKGVPAAATEIKGQTSAPTQSVEQLTNELTTLMRTGAPLAAIQAKKAELLAASKTN